MGRMNAPPEVLELVERVKAENHPRLVECGVTILTQMHHSEKGLTLHGVGAYAVVGLIPEADRLAGMPDARIVIDAGLWGSLPEARQTAIIDHELFHLHVTGKTVKHKVPVDLPDDALALDPDGKTLYREEEQFLPDLDSAGRPKLRMRNHDWDLGGFAEIIRRHGPEAVDRRGFLQVAEAFKDVLDPDAFP